MFFKNIKLIHSFILSFANITFMKENIKQESVVKKKNWNKINFQNYSSWWTITEHEYVMNLNEKNLKSVYNFIKKMLIVNNMINHKFNIIAEHAKYDNIIMMLKTNFQRYFFKNEDYKAFNEKCVKNYIIQWKKLFINQN